MASFGETFSNGLAGGFGGGLVGAGMGFVSSLFGPSLRKQWKYQKKQMALQQQYALEQMQKQSELNYGNWQKQFDYENDYNKPTNVFDRYREAGISPAGALGSSGVGVNATMSPGAVAGTSGASGPSAGNFDFSNRFAGVPGDAMQAMQMKSQIKLNEAIANNQNAQGNKTANETQTPDVYRRAANASIDLMEAGVTEKKAQAAWMDVQSQFVELERDWYSLRQNAEILQIQNITAQIQQLIDHNKAMFPVQEQYAERFAAAELSVMLANANNMLSEADLNRLNGQDIQHWLNVNWNNEFEVQEYDKAGRPIEGKFRRMTGEQMAAEVKRYAYEVASLQPAKERYNIRSEKNAFGYGIVQSILHGALGMAGFALTKGKSAASRLSADSTPDSQQWKTDMSSW